MKKTKIGSGILRQVFAAVGAFVSSNAVNPAIWEQIMGGVMMAVSFLMTYKAKALTVEKVQSMVLKIVIIFSVLKGTGTVSDATIGVIATISPIIYSILSKMKNRMIAEGNIQASQLSQ